MTVKQISDTADQFVNQMIAVREAHQRLSNFRENGFGEGHVKYHELKDAATEQQTRLNIMASVVQAAVGYDWYQVVMKVAHAEFPR